MVFCPPTSQMLSRYLCGMYHHLSEQVAGPKEAAAAPPAQRPGMDIPPSTTHPLNSIVLMLNPSVGLTVLVSSPLMCFTMVVLPALSRPLWQEGSGVRIHGHANQQQ